MTQKIEKLFELFINTTNNVGLNQNPKITSNQHYLDPMSDIKNTLQSKGKVYSNVSIKPIYGIALEDSKPIKIKDLSSSKGYLSLINSSFLADRKSVDYVDNFYITPVMIDPDLPDPEDYPDGLKKKMAMSRHLMCFTDPTTLPNSYKISKNSLVLVQILDSLGSYGVITHSENSSIDRIVEKQIQNIDVQNLFGAKVASTLGLYKKPT